MPTEEEIVAELRRIARQPENRRCANCEKEDSQGHGNVCVPFRTFVCSMCKAKNVSHR